MSRPFIGKLGGGACAGIALTGVAWFAAAPPADGTSAVPGSARHAARSRGSRRWAGCLKWRSTTWLQQVVVWRKGGHAPPGVVALGEDDGSNTGGGGPTGLTRTLKLVAASATPEPPRARLA